MAGTFQFDLVAPERAMASAVAKEVTAPGVDGDFGVAVGHAPFLTVLRPGIVTATLENGERKKFVVYGGFAEVGPDHCTILAEEVQAAEEMSAEAMDARIQAAEKDLADADNASTARLAQRLNDLKALKMHA